MQIMQIYFRSNSVDLYGALFLPKVNVGRDAYVVCHPFAEEKKSSQKTLVDISRRLANRGKNVLMFDFQGCGDSHGKLSECNLHLWLKNLDDAITYMFTVTGSTDISVIGLRSGATMLWPLTRKANHIKRYILFEPVQSLKGYLDNLIKQKMVNELMTYGRVERTKDLLVQDLLEGNSIDLDGHEISSGFYKSLRDFDNAIEAGPLDEKLKIDIISLSISGAPSTESEKFFKKIGKPSNVNFQTIKLESFWNKIDGVDINPLLEAVDRL